MRGMSRSFGWIFWGLLLAYFQFTINGIDLLPDVLGYAFVAVGCHGLVKSSASFRKAALLSWILAAFELTAYFDQTRPSLYNLVWSAVDIAMFWMLLGGIILLAKQRQWEKIGPEASKRRLAYVVLATGSMLLGNVPPHRADEWGLVGAAFVVAMLVVMILILILVHRVKIRSREGEALPVVS